MNWEPEYYEVNLAQFGLSDVVVVGVVNMPAPLVRETVGMLGRVSDLADTDAVAALLPRYYRLLGMWLKEVRNGERVFPLGTAEAVQSFEENEDWAVLGLALQQLMAERERRRADAARRFRETNG